MTLHMSLFLYANCSYFLGNVVEATERSAVATKEDGERKDYYIQNHKEMPKI